jgi:hypothetical protein
VSIDGTIWGREAVGSGREERDSKEGTLLKYLVCMYKKVIMESTENCKKDKKGRRKE